MNDVNKVQISVVLGSYNRFEFLKLAINSIRTEVIPFSSEIIVIDGGSCDGSLEWLAKQKDIITILQHNRARNKTAKKPWGYFMNLGFKCAHGKYICMLSDDCLIIPGAILKGYSRFENLLNEGRKIGAMAFYWRDWSVDDLFHVGVPIGNKMYVNHGMYLNSALNEVGYIDENSYKFYFADIDLCFKMWDDGYECVDSPNSYIEHYPHANKKIRLVNNLNLSNDFISFFKKWHKKFPLLDNQNIMNLKEKKYIDSLGIGMMFSSVYKKQGDKNLFNMFIRYFGRL
ncbi:glycosyltransferase family 2 protein [Candidatus Dependentiae bacterium]